MQRFIPSNGMQPIYAIPQQQQQMPQSIAIPQQRPTFTMNMAPINSMNANQYQAHTSYGAPPQHMAHPQYHHANQQSIGQPIPGQAINGYPYVQTYTATSPVDNYSIYNGSVYNQTNPNASYQQLMQIPPQVLRRSIVQATPQQQIQMKQTNLRTSKNGQNSQSANNNENESNTNAVEMEEENNNESPDDNENQNGMHNNEEIETEEIHNDDGDNESDANDINDLLEGDAILAADFVGIIRYLGPLFLNPFNTAEITKEQYIGVECSSESETDGKGHDGWYKDFRYFKTKNGKNTGLLIQSSEFTKKLSPFRLLQTIKKEKIAIGELQNSMQSLKAQNKLLKLNLEALLLQQHKMKQFFAKLIKNSNNGQISMPNMDEIKQITEIDDPLPMLARKSNNSTENDSQKNAHKQMMKRRKSRTILKNGTQRQTPTNINAEVTHSHSGSDAAVTPITPEPLKGFQQRSGHTAQATTELSIHLDRLPTQNAHKNNNLSQTQMDTPTDRMLDNLQQTQGLSTNDIVGGSAKHIVLRNNNGSPHNSPHSSHHNTAMQPHSSHNSPHSNPQIQMGQSGQSIVNNHEYRTGQGNSQRSIHNNTPTGAYYVEQSSNGYNNHGQPQYIEQQMGPSQSELIRGMTETSIQTGTSMGTPTPNEYSSNTSQQLQQLQQNGSASSFPQYQPQQNSNDPYTLQMNGQYYTTAGPSGPYGYNPGVIQEQQHYYTSENINPNNGHHPSNQYSIEMVPYPNGYPSAMNGQSADSPMTDTSRSTGYRYSSFLKKLVVAHPQQQQQNMGHMSRAMQHNAQAQQQQNITGNEEAQEQVISDIAGGINNINMSDMTPMMDEENNESIDDNTMIEYEKSNRNNSREYRNSYTGSHNSSNSHSHSHSHSHRSPHNTHSHGHSKRKKRKDKKSKNSHNGYGYNNKYHSPSNSANNTPNGRRRNKYTKNDTDSDSDHGYPNTNTNDERAIMKKHKSKHKSKKERIKMKQISTNTQNSNNKKSYNRSQKNYINIDTPTSTSLSANISASNIINLAKYKKPEPLPIIDNSEAFMAQRMTALSTNNEHLLLKDRDTMAAMKDSFNADTQTHKTVDLPSPNTNHSNSSNDEQRNKRNKKKSRNKHKKRQNDSDDDGTELMDEYDTYTVTPTVDESPEPGQASIDNTLAHEPGQHKNKRLLYLNKQSKSETPPKCEFGDEYEASDNITDLAITAGNIQKQNGGNSNKNEPRFSTLSIDSEMGFNADINELNEYDNINLIVEDESYMDSGFMNNLISPRKDSKIIEFYVPKHMNNDQIKSCFGLFEPIKIIPHNIDNQEMQGSNKKIEAIFENHETAVKAVQMLKHQNLKVVFKKSPRQTLVMGKDSTTPTLLPINSKGPFNYSFAAHQKEQKKLNLVPHASESTAGGEDDAIVYRPHRIGAQQIINENAGKGDNENENDEDEENESFDWTEGSSSAGDESGSDVWAMERGFGSSDDENGVDEEQPNEENDHSIIH